MDQEEKEKYQEEEEEYDDYDDDDEDADDRDKTCRFGTRACAQRSGTVQKTKVRFWGLGVWCNRVP